MNKKYTYIIVVLLILASLIAFGRILGNDFVNFDDGRLITENNYVKAGFNAESIKWAFTNSSLEYWHPLTWLSIMLEWRLFGANASGYHLVSLLWHIGSAILLFLFLSKTTGSLWPSAFVTALFALHPLRVESVAWASERKDVLNMFFGMATLYAYAHYVEGPKLSKYFLCLILFVLALMSKPMMITLPCVLLLLDYWPLGRWQKVLTPHSLPVLIDKRAGKKKSNKLKVESSEDKKMAKPVQGGLQLTGNLLWEKVPFFFLALSMGIMVVWQLREDGYLTPLQQIPLSERILNAIVSYVAYLGKTFWPVDLAVFYPYVNSFPIWQVLGASLLLLGISAAVIYLVKKAPFLFAGWFWYLGVLFPVIGLMQNGEQAIADRYTYFPSIGIAIMLVWGVFYLLPKVKPLKIILLPAAVIILSGLTILTWRQCGYWENGTKLFNHALKSTKNNDITHYHLGVALAAQGKNKEAIVQYRTAIEINPNNDKAQNNLGFALASEGENEEAIAHYLAAIKINPNGVLTHFNLAIAFEKLGKFEEAIARYREVLSINPDYFGAHINLGNILKMQSKNDEAIDHYRQALQSDPNNPGIYFNIGAALLNKGEIKKAAEHFRQAVYLKPDFKEAREALKLVIDMEKKTKG